MKSLLRMHDDILLMAKRSHNFLMRRKDREVTDREEIAAMIAGMDTIRIAMNAGDGPYIVPLSFGIEEVDDGFVFYMHSAISGRKIELIGLSPCVGFELDSANGLVAGSEACEFSMRYQSVIGTGIARVITDGKEKLHGMRKIMEHYTSRYDWDILETVLSHTAIIRLDAVRISAKRY